MKYKIVGMFNLLLGVAETVLPAYILFFILPKIYRLFSEFNADTGSPIPIYAILGTIICLGLINVYVGYNLLFISGNRIKYFHIGLIIFIISIILGGVLAVFHQKSALIPLLNLN